MSDGDLSVRGVVHVMAMMAVQDGLLRLDELAADTLTEWQTDPRKSKITVRHLLTLSSGLPAGTRELSGGRSGSRLLGEGAAKRAERLGLGDDAPRPENLNRQAIALPAVTGPGARFQYGPSHFYAFSELLQRKLKESDRPEKTTLAYLQQRLLEPIGIGTVRIGRDRAGNPNLSGGILLTARQWAKFGQFVLDGGSVKQPDGQWKSLLQPGLLAQCFAPSATNPHYGLTWWLRSADPAAEATGRLGRIRRSAVPVPAPTGPDGQPLKVMLAAGLGKQRLYVIRQHNLVVVRFAEATAQGRLFHDHELLQPILDGIW